MIDRTLINKLTELANKEKKIKEYKRRLRVKSKIGVKRITKKGNIVITVRKNENEYKFTVLKSHKERFELAEKLVVGKSVSVEGIPILRMIICTRLTALDKGVDESKQTKLV